MELAPDSFILRRKYMLSLQARWSGNPAAMKNHHATSFASSAQKRSRSSIERQWNSRYVATALSLLGDRA
jgi:hypothetical protein